MKMASRFTYIKEELDAINVVLDQIEKILNKKWSLTATEKKALKKRAPSQNWSHNEAK